MEEVIFKALNLTKKIDGRAILENVSFNFMENTVTAILGQNGSGKSITLKILAGIYEPTDGKIIRNTRRIGYVPEHFPKSLRFKLEEYLKMIVSINSLTKHCNYQKLKEYVKLFEIEPFLETPLKQCSKGTRQKVGIIQALLMESDVLLLDEPLTGLDIESQLGLIDILNIIKKEVAIIFTTHNDEMVPLIKGDSMETAYGFYLASMSLGIMIGAIITPKLKHIDFGKLIIVSFFKLN